MFSGALIYKSAALTAQNLTGNVAMVFNSELYDVGGWADTNNFPSRITVPAGADYAEFMGGVQLDNVTANQLLVVRIFKNGAALTQEVRIDKTTNRTTVKYQISTGPLAVSAGDYFEMFVQVAGADTSVDVAAGTWLAGWKAPAIANTFSGATVNKAADQSAADYSAGAAITWDNEVEDVGGWHDAGSNTERLTVPAGVAYARFMAFVAVQAFTAGQWLDAQIRKNGSALTQFMAASESHGSATILRFGLSTPPLPVTPGDYFTVFLQTQTDASITITATRNWFSGYKVD